MRLANSEPGWLGGRSPATRVPYARPTVTHCSPTMQPNSHPLPHKPVEFGASRTRKRPVATRAIGGAETGARTSVERARHGCRQAIWDAALQAAARFRPSACASGVGRAEMTPTRCSLRWTRPGARAPAGRRVLGTAPRLSRPPCSGGDGGSRSPARAHGAPRPSTARARASSLDRRRQARPVVDDLDPDAGRAAARPRTSTRVRRARSRSRSGCRSPARAAASRRARTAAARRSASSSSTPRLGRDRPPGATESREQLAEIDRLDLARGLARLRRMREVVERERRTAELEIDRRELRGRQRAAARAELEPEPRRGDRAAQLVAGARDGLHPRIERALHDQPHRRDDPGGDPASARGREAHPSIPPSISR